MSEFGAILPVTYCGERLLPATSPWPLSDLPGSVSDTKTYPLPPPPAFALPPVGSGSPAQARKDAMALMITPLGSSLGAE